MAGLFVMLTVSSGLGFYNHAVILHALSRDGGFSVELASTAVSLFFLVNGLTGLIVAPLLERYDVRIIVTVSAVLVAVSLWLVGKVTTEVGLLCVYSLYGIGFCGSGLLPATTLVARWFEANRARALSIASTGLSVGGITLTPISAWLVESYRLELASEWMGFMFLLGVVPAAIILLRSSPAEVGLQPDGRGGSPVDNATGATLADAVTRPFFWSMSFAFMLVLMAQVGGIAHQYGLLAERLSVAQASWAIAILPLSSVVGRLAGGAILDRINTRGFSLLMMVCHGGALMLLGVVSQPWGTFVGLALFGVSVGNLLMLQPLMIAEVYGLRHYSRIFAWSNLLSVLGIAGGPVLMGVLFGYSGDYRMPYLVAGLLSIVACLLLLSVKTLVYG